LSMFITMAEPVILVPGADSGPDLTSAAVEFDSAHTLAPSFQRMPALPQSALVSGWLEAPANMVEDSACAAVGGWFLSLALQGSLSSSLCP
jgi:hypothetical protein